MFLKDAQTHTVGKWGIKHHRRKYWHDSLGELVGEDVRVRAAPYDKGPDEIEVFHKGRWVCTAFAYDSSKGEQVSGHDVARAQSRQRRGYRGHISEARRALRKVDKQIAHDEQSQQTTQKPPEQSSAPTPENNAAQDQSAASGDNPSADQQRPPQAPDKRGHKRQGNRKPDFLDRMGDDW
ncbi:Mu transposase C-terminal domain-containing protein [Chloroflexales bacterium ZM16-3]|nr:Mu transposase C-terminal domain-containing protein [Chloroflexales bacterium ZM16-3]